MKLNGGLLVIGPLVMFSAVGQAPSAGEISGRVVDDAGKPIAAARIYYSKVPERFVSGPRGRAVPDPKEKLVRDVISSDAEGKFRVPGAGVGSYRLCAEAPGTPYLNPCKWGTDVRTDVTASASTSTLIVMKKGVFLRVRIEDPLGLLPKITDGTIGGRVRVGVIYRSGAYQGLNNTTVDGRGRDYVLPVPDDEPLSVWITARDLTVADQDNKAVGQPALIPFQPALGQEQRFTFTITGPKL